MKVHLKPSLAEAIQYDGTHAGAEAAAQWLSDNDTEDCEVSWQGEAEPLGLDVRSDKSIVTAEATDWLVLMGGSVIRFSAETFAQYFGTAE